MADRFTGLPSQATGALEKLDPKAEREFNTLAEFLSGLSQQQTAHETASLDPVLASINEMEQSPRWLVGLRGVRRLARLAALRERLLQAPSCLAARVVDLSSAEIHLLVTTTARITREELEAMLAEAMVQADCPASFAIQPQPSTGGG